MKTRKYLEFYNSFKSLILNLMLLCFSSLFFILVCECLAYYYVANLQPSTQLPLWKFRDSSPLPYKNAPFYSNEFIEESKRQPGGYTFVPNTRIVLPNNFSGKWFNVRNNIRATKYQPKKPEAKIFIFGGSTVYNSEVPDQWTIASQFQKLINTQTGGKYQVINMGVSTINSAQQLERLKSITVAKDDIVIFYDGVNEAVQGVFYNNPAGWIIGDNRKRAATIHPYLLHLILLLREHSTIYNLLAPMIAQPPEHVSNKNERKSLIARSTNLYRKNIIGADQWTKDKGAKFIHILQPQLFTQTQFTEYEVAIQSNQSFMPLGIKESLISSYPVFQKALKKIKNLGIKHYDFTTILNGDEEYYFDFCHVNHKANYLIAQNLFRILLNIKKETNSL